MKKEILFFTDNSEIGTPNVPVKNKQFKDGGVENGDYQKVELELSNNSKSNYLSAFKQQALFDYNNEKIKFVGLDTFGDDYRMNWIKIQENNSGYFVRAKYFGGVVYIDNYIQILNDYKNQTNPKMAEGGLIAPNGNPTKLTPEQYKLVRTPEFKAWFGDWENSPETSSKVVDENGEPLVLYHFSTEKFNVFELKGNSDGFFFTPLKKDIEFSFKGNRQSYFLNIKILGVQEDIYHFNWSIPHYENRWIEDAKENKENGIVFIKYVPYKSNQIKKQGKKMYVAFEPNQIKLANGKNTTFDGNNPDIRYKDGGSIDNERIDCHRCDWSWKVVDGGDDLYVCHKCGYDNAPYYATKFAGGGGIDINEPFNVNGKTLAERVRILVKQLYPDYKWSITSSYSKMDVYLLEADFDPFTDLFQQENPDRKYYSVDDRDLSDYNRQNNAKITERAVEVFKPIRDYINKFIVNYNANDPYADYSSYNVYEYTYIGKWDKPYKQVEPKIGKKAKAKATVTPATATTTPSPTTLTPRADYPFQMGDILAISQEKLNRLGDSVAKEVAQFYYEVAEMISTTQQYFIKYNDKNESQTVTVEVLDILKDYVKATALVFKMGDTVVRKLSPENPLKVVHRSYYEQIAVKYSTPEKRFLLSGITWSYALEDTTYANENELEKYNSSTKNTTEPKFKVEDIVTYRSTGDKKYKVIEFIEFDSEIQENIYRIESLSDKTKGKAKESMMSLVESKPKFNVGDIVSYRSSSRQEKKYKVTSFTGFSDIFQENMYNIEGLEDSISLATIESQMTLVEPAAPTAEPVSFLDYLVANNEKATLIPRDLEVMNSLALFIQSGKDIEELDTDRYATLLVNMIEKLTPNK
jgi:hypothetical protein